ncbi:hypothetical protein [Rhizosaccharibacter radicis]|uniref:BA14K family protein n=1 Tax=Rhizosaccharibacter radicis TaxID=2782605 RepID=A0ABT1VYS3_9PROT|nr:BA14K family protein [Acetobacteraceae bacterium KSS12]
MLSLVPAGAVALLLSGCEDTPATSPAPAATAVAAAPRPAATAAGVAASGTVPLANDPSAPADTPLCGTAAREANDMGRNILASQYAQAGICSSFACYDPATATYIGADGYRHVCR